MVRDSIACWAPCAPGASHTTRIIVKPCAGKRHARFERGCDGNGSASLTPHHHLPMCPACGTLIEPANINNPAEYRDLIRRLISLVHQGTLRMSKGSCSLERVLEDPRRCPVSQLLLRRVSVRLHPPRRHLPRPGAVDAPVLLKASWIQFRWSSRAKRNGPFLGGILRNRGTAGFDLQHGIGVPLRAEPCLPHGREVQFCAWNAIWIIHRRCIHLTFEQGERHFCIDVPLRNLGENEDNS